MENKLTAKKVFQEVKSYFFIFLGLALFTFGWSAFLTPYEVAGGGVAGAASILYFATKIPIGLTTFALNAILIAIAWRILGTKFCVNSLICTVVMSVFFSLFQPMFPKPIVEDMFMSVIIGSAIAACGVGMAINWGGNTGGVDIVALMIGKYRNISYGRVSLFSNILIVGSSYFVVHDVQKLVYSFVVLIVSIIVSDLVIDGYRQTYQFMVFSQKNREIAQKINTRLHRGATFLKGYGSYNQQESDVLLIVAHRTDKGDITRIQRLRQEFRQYQNMRKDFEPVSVRVNAKLNLGLQIVRKRPDGYHDLQTVFIPTDFYTDTLELLPHSGDLLFDVKSTEDLGDPYNNLCVKAYRLLQCDYGIEGVEIRLHKGIPTGAGLGGGSADAAFTLQALTDIFQLPISKEKMEEYALQLGSDVPFFLYNQPMYATGRGEVMTPIDLDLSVYRLKIVKPDIHVSTKEAYAGITPQESDVFLPQVLQQPIETWKDVVTNDFEKTVFAKHPELEEIKESFYRDGALYASMSGSGSAIFSIFPLTHKP